MDFSSIFRRFFHNDYGSMSDPFFERDDETNYGRRNTEDYDEYFESLNQHINVFQQVEDMFNEMFTSSFGLFGSSHIERQFPEESVSPRSLMIRDDEEKPCESSSCKKDSGRSDLFFGNQQIEKPRIFHYSTFSSVKTVRLPDGTIEEHKTVIDNDGNKTTVVRRAIGDTSHEIITKSDEKGIKEKEENYMNMDENELSNFEQKWNTLRNSDPMTPPDAPSLSLPSSNPSYWNIFRKLFGPSHKDELKWI